MNACATFAEPTVAGYWCGGQLIATICKTDFSNDSTANIAETLTTAVYYPGGLNNGSTAGYSAGGHDGSSAIDTIDKTDFSDDSTAAIVPTLSVARYYLSGLASGIIAGYWCAGTPNKNVIDKTDFSDDSTAAIASTFSGYYGRAAFSSAYDAT